MYSIKNFAGGGGLQTFFSLGASRKKPNFFFALRAKRKKILRAARADAAFLFSFKDVHVALFMYT